MMDFRLYCNRILVMFLLLSFLPVDLRGQNLELTFSRSLPGNTTIDFITSADTRVNYSFDYVSQPQRRIYSGQNNPIQIDKGTTSASFTVDNPEYIVKLDLAYKYTALAGKITDVVISGLSGLKAVDVSAQAITQPLSVPDGCTVTYGNQEPLTIEILDDNLVDLSSHSHQSWSVVWSYDGTNLVDNSFIEKLPGGFFRFNSNLESPVMATLTHPSGLVLTTNYITPNKLLETALKLQLDGRGTGTLARFVAGTTNDDFIIKINESSMSSSGHVDLNLPSLAGYSGTVEIKSNHPEYLTALFLENLGIEEIASDNKLGNLQEIHLAGNSLLPSKIPAFINNLEYVFLGSQNPFTLTVVSDGTSFDLSEELNAGASVEWIDQNGKIIDASLYECENGIYRFNGFGGSAQAHLTMQRFKDYEIFSEPAVIDRSLQPILNVSWAGASLPATITIEADDKRNVRLYAGDDEYVIPASGKTDIRLPSSSGSTVLMADYPGNIKSINLDNINAYSLSLNESLEALEFLSLDNNRFSPFSLPKGIPVNCTVNWGRQADIDISGYVSGRNSIDLFEWRNLGISWMYFDNDLPVKESYITERGGVYTFGNVGKIYALITVPGLDGVTFRTAAVTFSSSFYPVISFDCNGEADVVTAQIFVSAPTEFEIAGKLTEPVEGIVTVNFSNGSIGNNTAATGSNSGFLTLNCTNPENIMSIVMPAMGITSISVDLGLTNLEYLELSQNYLIFKTFPAVPDGCYVNLSNQRPVQLTVNTATGHIDLSDFKDCHFNVVDSEKFLIDSDLWCTDEDNGGLTFLSTVEDVIIELTHDEYPGITLYSIPLSYSKISALNDVKKPTFELRGRTISLPTDVSGTIYNTMGQAVETLNKGASVNLQPGTYVINLSDGYKGVILIH